MHPVEVKQRMGEQDIAAVAALLAAATDADGHAPMGEHAWLDLVEGGREGFAGFVAREPGHERLVGYAQLSRGTGSWAIESVVHPDYREPDHRIAIDLLQRVFAEIKSQGGGSVHMWVPKPDKGDDFVAESLGLVRGRELYQMRRSLPLEESLSSGELLATRSFRVGQDEQAWLELNAAAFAQHPDQGAWGLDTLLDRERQAWFDPKGFLLYEQDSKLGAFCWTKVHEELAGRVGEIYVIGVDPALQGQGLGRAMVVAGLSHLAAEGIEVAMLYVDADNTPAVSLYRSLGFSIDHHDVVYLGEVQAA